MGEGPQPAAERSRKDAARFSMLRGKLLELREKRVRPGLDDKVLADWNGLMIAALINAGVILEELDWLEMARRQPAVSGPGVRFRRYDPRRTGAP